ncbi:peptidoglycan binding protein CsiV [Pseudoalteromonas neustonica]|uniref:Peptidoglycan binding protein CsiV n=1 Tax=Pseudoalteromonas neustonica TaxID=1840331 RepID=A0ABU9U259_9GAMM|nr:peptidoglycan binding protein CsiV [Pseudoalteromonas neustonica]
MLFKKSLLLLCCVFSSTAFAERWFEVEVLIFKQRPAPYMQEDFSLDKDPIKKSNNLDLLTPIYEEQAKQDCINGDSRFNSASFTDSLISVSRSNLCDESIDYLSSYNVLPLSPLAPVRDDMEQTYLLAPEQLKFIPQQQSLVRKGLKPLLHTGWRFKGASKSRSEHISLFGGQLIPAPYIAKTANYQSDDFINQVSFNSSLPTTEEKASDSWELEGVFNIYLRHYLFINANFDINEALPTGDIQRARFSQFKRVISNEVHYFDHPKMGMIVQIRKFKH